MTTPEVKATPNAYTISLAIEGAPPELMPYSRVLGRKYQPFHVVLTWEHRGQFGGTGWDVRAEMTGWICRKDGTPGIQQTEVAYRGSELPEWLTALANEHRPAGAA